MEHDYTFGIEEEYFLNNAATGNVVTRATPRLLPAAQAELGANVTAELLQSQIEIASPILHSAAEAREVMSSLRARLAHAVSAFRLRLVAASTHPLGVWREQLATERPRYDKLLSDFRIIGQRNLVCGMHVHVAIPAGIDRIELMNRVIPWVPLFLALSTSSPFWGRQATGLLSYRQAIYDEWPRSGIPDFFRDEADYEAFVDVLRKGEAIADASYLWWTIRPSLRFPTLELRIADVCTRLEDALALAGLYRCLVATLVARPELGATRTTHTRRIVDENRWRAKRDGTQARFIDETSGASVPVAQCLRQVCSMTATAMHRLGHEDVPERLQQIIETGTSARVQLRIYNDQRAAGATKPQALRAVVDWLARTTLAIPVQSSP